MNSLTVDSIFSKYFSSICSFNGVSAFFEYECFSLALCCACCAGVFEPLTQFLIAIDVPLHLYDDILDDCYECYFGYRD